MKRLQNTDVLQKCNIYYDHDGTPYWVGTLSKEYMRDRKMEVYVFDIDKKSVDKLKSLDKRVKDWFIPGVDLGEHGYYQVFGYLPVFISTRVIDPRRPDLQEYLDRFDMAYYDAFEMFLRNEGRQLDNFHVEKIDLGLPDDNRQSKKGKSKGKKDAKNK
jgi:hypothetical protein